MNLESLMELSRMSIQDNEKDSILETMNLLQSVVERLDRVHIVEEENTEAMESYMDLREDIALPSYHPADLLPNTKAGYVIVPNIME